MDKVVEYYKLAKKKYDAGGSPFDEILLLTKSCYDVIGRNFSKIDYSHKEKHGQYFVFYKGKDRSRPVNKRLFVSTYEDLKPLWNDLLEGEISGFKSAGEVKGIVDSVIYSVISVFSVCYDIEKKGSRKTPGTFFEVLLGSLLAEALPGYERTKFIAIPDQVEKVSTDIVFDKDGAGVVIPAKITTRERVVQPYAHQRILDSVFGKGRYKSVLMCVSETQADHTNEVVNDICVPGTIRLFQNHLSELSAIYYLDPPERYMQADLQSIIKVSTYNELFSGGLRSITNALDS